MIERHSLQATEPPKRSFTPTEAPHEIVHVEKVGTEKKGDVSIVFPSTTPNKETNQTAFGHFIANWITQQVSETQDTKKIPIIDLPTGSTPKAVWPELSRFSAGGQLNTRGIVLTGHEATFGAPIPDGPVDYDRSRRKILEEVLGISLVDITHPDQIRNTIQGNYVSMDAYSRSPESSARTYDQTLHALHGRDDVRFIGVYGVGKDGHVAEIQTNTLTGAADYDTQHAFAYPITYNSDIRGAVSISGDPDRKLNNNMRQPGQEPNYHGGTHLTGPGWEDLLLHEELMLAFNDPSKALAFQSTLEGSVDSIVTDTPNTYIRNIQREAGKGESIYLDLRSYAQRLTSKGLLTAEVVETIDASDDPKKSKLLFKAIHDSLYKKDITRSPQQEHEILKMMWGYAKEYLGKQTPVSVLVRLRTLLGLDTTIVATPEVVQNTPYKHLAPIEK